MFLQLALDQTQGHACAVDRHVDLFQKVCQTADVVLVSVGDNDATNLILVALHIGEVRDDNVYTRHIHIRECQTAVQDKHIVAALEYGHILTDLVETAQGNDTHRSAFLPGLTGLLCAVVVSGTAAVAAVSAGLTLAAVVLRPGSCAVIPLAGLRIISYFSYLFCFVSQINILTFSRGDSTITKTHPCYAGCSVWHG